MKVLWAYSTSLTSLPLLSRLTRKGKKGFWWEEQLSSLVDYATRKWNCCNYCGSSCCFFPLLWGRNCWKIFQASFFGAWEYIPILASLSSWAQDCFLAITSQLNKRPVWHLLGFNARFLAVADGEEELPHAGKKKDEENVPHIWRVGKERR